MKETKSFWIFVLFWKAVRKSFKGSKKEEENKKSRRGQGCVIQKTSVRWAMIDIIKENFEIAVKFFSCSCCQEPLNCESAVRWWWSGCAIAMVFSIYFISKFFFLRVARSSTNSSSRGSGSHCKTEGQEDSVKTKVSEESGLEDEETSKIEHYFCNVEVKILLLYVCDYCWTWWESHTHAYEGRIQL